MRDKSKLNVIVLGLSFLVIIGVKSIEVATSEDKSIDSIPLEEAIEESESEILEKEECLNIEVEDGEDFIVYLDDWKEYRDKQYVPRLSSNVINISVGKAKVEARQELGIKDERLQEVVEKLNPYNAGPTDVMSYGWDMAYGVTQINVKLVPLATLKYPDFETNPKSQINFLKEYIDVKKSKGYNLEEIIRQYKLCEYE